MGSHYAGSFQGQEPQVLDAEISHPDCRLHADSTATREQHRPYRAAGSGRGVGRDAILTYQRVRRGSCLPTEQAARVALRTQQIIAYESGVPQSIDPLTGSYYVESLTDEIEKRADEYLKKIDALGGMLKAIERGYVQQEIQNAAYEYQRQVDHQEAIVVGVNRFTVEEEKPIPIQRIDEVLERRQVGRRRPASSP